MEFHPFLFLFLRKKIINERIRYRKDMEEINKEKIILKKGDKYIV